MKKKHLLLLLPVIVTLIIFSFSLQDSPTSSAISNQFTNTIKELFSTYFPNTTPAFTINNGKMRVFAHISLFFCLGNVLFATTYVLYRKVKTSVILTFAYGLFIALADEFIQFFSPGRASQLIDVCKDLFGVTLSVLLWLAILYGYQFYKKHQTKHPVDKAST